MLGPATRSLTSRTLLSLSPRNPPSRTLVTDPRMADGTASTSTSTSTPAPSTEQQPLVMQIIVDRELVKQPGWTRGPLMAQSAHAALAACHISSTSPNTTAYLGPENLAHMHKIVLQTPSDNGKTTLTALSERLAQARKEWEATREGEEVPLHYLWIEQPENIPTCLALAPNRKPPAVKKILNKCSLLRD